MIKIGSYKLSSEASERVQRAFLILKEAIEFDKAMRAKRSYRKPLKGKQITGLLKNKL